MKPAKLRSVSKFRMLFFKQLDESQIEQRNISTKVSLKILEKNENVGGNCEVRVNKPGTAKVGSISKAQNCERWDLLGFVDCKIGK